MYTNENNLETVSIKKAAEILGVKYATAYKWIILEKRIDHINYGKTKIAVKKSVEAFKLKHLVVGTEQCQSENEI